LLTAEVKASARRQKLEGFYAEGKKALKEPFLTFVNWRVISAACTSEAQLA
jgi:hypothetical protein